MKLHALTCVTQCEAADVILHGRALEAAISRGASFHRHTGSRSSACRRLGRLPCVHRSEVGAWALYVLHHDSQ